MMRYCRGMGDSEAGGCGRITCQDEDAHSGEEAGEEGVEGESAHQATVHQLTTTTTPKGTQR